MHFGPKNRVYGIDVCTYVLQKARANNSPAWDSVLYKPLHLQVQIVAKPPKILPFSVIGGGGGGGGGGFSELFIFMGSFRKNKEKLNE